MRVILSARAIDRERSNEVHWAAGLSLSDAVRLFLHRVVVEQAIPWEFKVPKSRDPRRDGRGRRNRSETPATLSTADELLELIANEAPLGPEYLVAPSWKAAASGGR